jgi:hypothetical protein
MENFLRTTVADHVYIARESDSLRLRPRMRNGGLPNVYDGMFLGIEHLVHAHDGTVAVSAEPIVFSISFPPDYLVSTDATLLYRVVSVRSDLLHPNRAGSVLCVGRSFRPGTRLRTLVHQLHAVFSCQNFATESPLDAAASRYYIAHGDQIRALRARPLWRRPLARVLAPSGAVEVSR